jgi:hypothetical protein
MAGSILTALESAAPLDHAPEVPHEQELLRTSRSLIEHFITPTGDCNDAVPLF